MEKLRLDLDVLLPAAHGERDQCVADLINALDRLDGVDSVHIVNQSGDTRAEVCLHLEPGAVSLARLEDRVRATGAEIESRYGHLIFESTSVGHTGRARALSQRLQDLPGVLDGAVSVNGLVRAEYDVTQTSEGEVLASLETIGIRPQPARIGSSAESKAEPPDHGKTSKRSDDPGLVNSEHGTAEDRGAHSPDDGHDHGHGASRVELGAAFVSLFIYLIARFGDWFTDIEGPIIALYVVAAVLTGVFVARDAWLSIRARVFDIDQLMLVAAIGAAFIGHWSDSALLLVLFSLGHALEGYAMDRARNAIEALSELAPATARRKDDPLVEVPVEDLIVGDVILVRPSERLAADGVVVAGQSAIDQSAVTGESVPVDKTPIADQTQALAGFEQIDEAHRVFAGTLNGNGAIEVMVLRVAADSTLSRVVEMVAEAETQISPTQRLTKRIVRIFVPSVLTLVIGLLIIPPLLGEPFAESFGRAMAVLVAASPCALAIATPSAVLAAIARAAKSGILVKGGGPLEALGSVTAIAFDKTGTLTEGKPVLTDIEPADGVAEIDLLRATLAIEGSSDHPIARAIVAGITPLIENQEPVAATDVNAVHGQGLVGTFEGLQIRIGNAALFEDGGLPDVIADQLDVLQGRGRTTMAVQLGTQFLGVLGVMDTPRPEAESAIADLRKIGIETIVMLSGDNQRVATAVGQQVGIADARGGLMPAGKVEVINRLASSGGVAMIGDGVNDAPALAAANVGIAMGAAGSDVALETADIALMADRIDHLPGAVDLSRRASRTIKQNLFFSLGVVAVLLPLTLMGVGISVAVIAHEGSTLVVVINALLLLRYKL